MSKPRRFSEKIALLNKKEAEGNAEFERIIKEVEETTRASTSPTANRASPRNSNWLETGYSVQQPTRRNFPQTDKQYNNFQQLELQCPQQILDPINLEPQQLTSIPNIRISPIEEYPQQVIQPPLTNYPISSARSLPDMTNTAEYGVGTYKSLRQQATAISPSTKGNNTTIGPAYSDQRISTSRGYAYDHETGTDILPNQQDCYGDVSYNMPHINMQSPQFDSTGRMIYSWQPTSSYCQAHNNPAPVDVQENYYQQQSQSIEPAIARASSTNAVVGSWHNNNDLDSNIESLDAPRTINNNLSKSTDVYYMSYGDSQNMPINPHVTNMNPAQQIDQNPRVRSASFNDFDDVDWFG